MCTKMWTEITDLIVFRNKLLKFLQGALIVTDFQQCTWLLEIFQYQSHPKAIEATTFVIIKSQPGHESYEKNFILQV